MRDGVQPTLCYARGWCVECQDGICNAPVSTMELGRAQLRHCPRRPERPPSLSGGLGASNSNTRSGVGSVSKKSDIQYEVKGEKNLEAK